MTGPEHYRKAEAMLEHSLRHTDTGSDADTAIANLAVQAALAHAMLAQVALHVTGTSHGWREAVG
jgi:hypothetical protein